MIYRYLIEGCNHTLLDVEESLLESETTCTLYWNDEYEFRVQTPFYALLGANKATRDDFKALLGNRQLYYYAKLDLKTVDDEKRYDKSEGVDFKVRAKDGSGGSEKLHMVKLGWAEQCLELYGHWWYDCVRKAKKRELLVKCGGLAALAYPNEDEWRGRGLWEDNGDEIDEEDVARRLGWYD
jgi:hypothetical protein